MMKRTLIVLMSFLSVMSRTSLSAQQPAAGKSQSVGGVLSAEHGKN
jgi:hypothetical protein